MEPLKQGYEDIKEYEEINSHTDLSSYGYYLNQNHIQDLMNGKFLIF